MSLTQSDLQEIRTIVREEVQPLEGRVTALENDIKEIYGMLTRIERLLLPNQEFKKMSLERRLLKLNRDLLLTAKEAGVTLPR